MENLLLVTSTSNNQPAF